MSDIAPAVVIVTLALVVAWVLRTYLTSRRQLRVAQLQAELQTRLLDRFGSADEVLKYLHSDAGRRFVESAAMERSDPRGRILGSVQAGIVLIALGTGFLAASGQPEAHFLGILAACLGAGFLVSAAASFALSRAWGLIERKRDEAEA